MRLRVASYNPWVCLYWLTTGKTVGGLPLGHDENLLDRQTPLKLWTKVRLGSQVKKISKVHTAGELADLVVLSDDYSKLKQKISSGLSLYSLF